jgi:hypothetical protein
MLMRNGNRHPVDELADVRDEVRHLQEREGELRKVLLQPGASLTGDEYRAEVRDWSKRQALPYERIVERFGKEVADGCYPTVDRLSVYLRKLFP